jgi:GrpB-like predicted nucleotidyltransferase (UPF0157 family)
MKIDGVRDNDNVQHLSKIMSDIPEAAVEIVPFDPEWSSRFEAERALLNTMLGPWLSGAIEHIGSTAVPGLAAKPVIDIMACVETLESSRDAISAVKVIGYCYFPYRSEVMHWFCKPSPVHRTHHLHLVPAGSPLWAERLAFRDYLRSHASVAAEYAELKRQLAERYRFDRERYTDEKAPFVREVLRSALSQ